MKREMQKVPWIDMVIPLAVGLGVALLYLFVPSFSDLTWRLYDLSLQVKPPIPEAQEFVIANIDDESIRIIGSYPLGRDIIARGLISLAEFEAEVITIDSEFLDTSPRGVREEYVSEQLPRYVQESFGTLGSVTEQIAQALATSDLYTAEDLPFLLEDYWLYNDEVQQELLDRIGQVVQDRDTYLGGAGRFTGRAYATVSPTFESATPLDPELKALIQERVPIRAVEVIGGPGQDHPFIRAQGVSPAIYPVLEGMAGAGSVVQPVDADGVRRRADLFFEWEGDFYPHLGLAGLLEWFGNPQVRVSPDTLTLVQVRHPTRGIMDINIPLGQDGKMIINWPRGSFLESFRHVPFSRLFLDQERIDNLAYNFQSIDGLDPRGLFGVLGLENPLDLFDQAEEALNQGMAQGGDEWVVAYRDNRQDFLNRVEELVVPGLVEDIVAQFDELAQDPGFPAEDQAIFIQKARLLEELIAAVRDDIGFIRENREVLAAEIPGSFVTIGYSGKSTTDIGVNPFENEYMNVGIFPAAMNTIYQRQFITDRPWWFSGAIIFPLVLLVPVLFWRLSPLQGFSLSLLLMVGVLGGFFGALVLAGVYLDQLMVLSLFGPTILFALVINFRRSTSQKAFITDAFGQYLSQEVIEELIDNPDKLKLGGEKREMTAIFTDIRGFSGISEKLDPSELVHLLNEYLSVMSDLILDQRGTIDKYEGDAIIAFFGAPMDLPDHALRACTAAVAMKRAEDQLNIRFQEKGLSTGPLFTRIGINTGPMVVGNMGTQRKKNYTIMGNSVNLAARLEGVNKQYGTSMLLSESSYAQTGNSLLVRRLDRVRVVGINTPVRLYQLLNMKAEATLNEREAVRQFEEGMDLFEVRKYRSAFKTWVELYKSNPKDETLRIYLERCKEYVQKPRPSDWDGVYDLTIK